MHIRTVKVFDTLDLSERHLPVISFESDLPGRHLWITANMHGDETTGIAVIHRVVATLKQNGLNAGRVTLMPTLNVTGGEMRQRNVALDDNDLNRYFPGNAKGRPAERLAHLIYSTILDAKPDLVIDLHTYSTQSLPFIILDHAHQRDTNLRAHLHQLAQVFGVTVVYDFSAEQYRRYQLDRSLTGALVNHAQIPAFVVELGPARITPKRFIDAGERGIMNLLYHFGMLPERPPQIDPSCIDAGYPLRRDPYVYASTTGIVDFQVEPGNVVRTGQTLALVRSIVGEVVESVRAGRDGYVLGLAEYTVVFPGNYLMTLAVKDD